MTIVIERRPRALEKPDDVEILPFADASLVRAVSEIGRNAIANVIGILHRIFEALLDAMHESSRTQAEREIANYFALRGGQLTDHLEREITRRLFTSNWSPPTNNER